MSFFIKNNDTLEVEITGEALQLKPFIKLVNRDKTKLKKKAKAELVYVYYYADYKSEFQSIIDIKEREEEIISVLDDLPKSWKPDKAVVDAIEFYRKRSETIASKALEKQRENIDKLIDKIGIFMQDDDANIVSKAAMMSKGVNQFIRDIDELEKIVKGQQELHQGEIRGSQEKSLLEDD